MEYEPEGVEFFLPDGTRLKGGARYHDGVVSDWIGRYCKPCNGTGESDEDDRRSCASCGGTGEEYGPIWLDEM